MAAAGRSIYKCQQSCSVRSLLSFYLFWAHSQSSSSEEKQHGLSVDKDLLFQLFMLCLVNLVRMEPLVHLDPRVRLEWMEWMESRDQSDHRDQLVHQGVRWQSCMGHLVLCLML